MEGTNISWIIKADWRVYQFYLFKGWVGSFLNGGKISLILLIRSLWSWILTPDISKMMSGLPDNLSEVGFFCSTKPPAKWLSAAAKLVPEDSSLKLMKKSGFQGQILEQNKENQYRWYLWKSCHCAFRKRKRKTRQNYGMGWDTHSVRHSIIFAGKCFLNVNT